MGHRIALSVVATGSLLLSLIMLAGGCRPVCNNSLPELTVYELIDCQPFPNEAWKQYVPYYESPTPPPDDAPTEALLNWWCAPARREPRSAAPSPSTAVQHRLLPLLLENPDSLVDRTFLLSEDPECMAKVKALLDREAERGRTYDHLERWLMLHSPYFRDKLIEKIRGIPRGDDLFPWREMEALLRLDFKTARDILLAIARADEKPIAAVTLLKYSLQPEGKELAGLKDEFRPKAMRIVEDWKALPSLREYALAALARDTWPGQEKWLEGLFADRTLLGGAVIDGVRLVAFVPLAAILDPPGRWLPLAIRLVKDPRPNVREAAAEVLSDLLNGHYHSAAREAALRELLPLLKDPTRADDRWEPLRESLVHALADRKMPEDIPDLLSLLETEQGEFVVAAIGDALARHPDPRAVPLLRKQFAKAKGKWSRSAIVGALLACGDYTLQQKADAITEKRVVDPEERTPLSEWAILSTILIEKPVESALAQAVLDRAGKDEQAGGGISQDTFRALLQWDYAPGHRWLIQRLIRQGLGTGEYPWPTTPPAKDESSRQLSRFGGELRDLLARASCLRKDAPGDLAQLRDLGGPKGALGAVLLGDAHAAERILRQGDTRSVATLLAAATLVRMPLPLGLVAQQLDGKEEYLAQAAEAYLRTERSPIAQAHFMAHRPGMKVIFGCPALAECDCVGNTPGPDEEWTLTQISGNLEVTKGITVRRQGDKAEVSYSLRRKEDPCPAPRPLTPRELTDLQTFIADNRVDDLPDFSLEDVHARPDIMVTYEHRRPSWGRCVGMNNPQFAAPFSVYGRLVKYFEDLASPLPPATRPAEVPSTKDSR